MNRPIAKKARSSVPFRTVLFSMCILWATYFVLITLRSFVIDYDGVNPIDYAMQVDMMWRRAVVTVAAIALTIALWGLLRLFDARPLWVRVTAAIILAIPVAIAIGKTNQLVFQSIQKVAEQKYAEKNGINLRRDESGNLLVDVPVTRVDPSSPDQGNTIVGSESVIIVPAESNLEMWRRVLDIALGRYFLLLAWASLYFALLAGVQARAAERREQEFRSAAKAAELRSLRYQVNPHFLFNTLNSLSALVMTGKAERAERMIQTMSRFYRHSLADEPTSDVALKDEFDLQQLYLDIEAVRFPERLVCDFDLPDDLAEARVPGMILQPLVENSVKYAVSEMKDVVTISVKAREEFDRLVITVSDNGPGVPAGVSHGFGIGLANVRDRLEARFGPDVALTSAPFDGGYSTEMRIPLTRHG